ncbi:MAG TPA: hypothetical protein VM598_03275 [Bdellovibrionota bacterium]|nr:hypothetical protein [Bdellovibrionota bacterium]
MNNLRPASPRSKGQMKCFRCRQSCAVRDGHWHMHENQQVFLCRACELRPADDKQEPFKIVK